MSNSASPLQFGDSAQLCPTMGRRPCTSASSRRLQASPVRRPCGLPSRLTTGNLSPPRARHGARGLRARRRMAGDTGECNSRRLCSRRLAHVPVPPLLGLRRPPPPLSAASRVLSRGVPLPTRPLLAEAVERVHQRGHLGRI